MKHLYFLFIYLFSSLTFAQTSEQEFIEAYRNKISTIAKEYAYKGIKPLNVEMFNLGKTSVYSFLSATHGKIKYEENFLSLIYYKNIIINGTESSLCVISYAPQKSSFINDYMKFNQMNFDEVINYLAYHEMGHCLSFHWLEHHNQTNNFTAKEEEMIADAFAIAHFINRQELHMAAKILRQIKRMKDTEIHANSDFIENFFITYISDPLAPKDFESLIPYIYKEIRK